MRILKDVVLLDGFVDRRGRKYDRREIEQQIKGKPFFGELDSDHGLDINLSRVSHSIENMLVSDSGLHGDIKILDTPCGKIAESLLDAGVKLTTSIRATGYLNEDQSVSDLMLITFDLTKEDRDEQRI